MIKKIQGSEYLKRYDNMTAYERELYENRVGQWLTDYGQMLAGKGEVFEARMQNVLQVSVTWNDQECQAFEEGACLLSAMTSLADTWLPEMLYVKSAKRAIKQMVEVLWGVDEGNTASQKPKEEHVEETGKETQVVEKKPAQPFQEAAGDGHIAGGDNEGEIQVNGTASIADTGMPTDITQENPGNRQVCVELPVPARPKHIDQYVHLLPEKTRERAAQVQGLYREMEEARQKMDLLMDDKTANPADREAWAKKATRCDNALRKIFDELDAEWAKLVKAGRVTVDDLGNARVIASPQNDETQETAELTSEQKARRRDLRKWLVDTRRGNGDTREEYKKRWAENFKEFLSLDGDKAFEDEKVMAAAKHYEVDIEKLR